MTTKLFNYTVTDEVAVITIKSPPVNTLSFDVKKSIFDGLEKLKKMTALKELSCVARAEPFMRALILKNLNQAMAAILAPRPT